ncbi:MAG TPA: hypothetical protein VF796_16135 [Humisphaera sp.]
MRYTKRFATALVALGLLSPLATPQPSAVAAGDNRAARAALARRMSVPNFKNTPLSAAIDHIRDVTQCNIWVNWKALEAAGVNPDTPINIDLRNVTLSKILTTMLAEAGGATAISFQVNDNVIEITTRELADREMVTRIYPIDDLIMEIPSFDNAPDFNLQNTNQGGQSGGGGGGGRGGGGGGGGGSIFGGNGGTQEKEKTKTRDERAQEIIDLIINTVRPDVWKDNGGTASIRHFNGKLVITAPPSIHELIGG